LLILLIEIFVGHLLGKLVRSQWRAYLFSVPVGVATYVSLLILRPLAAVPTGNEPAWAFVGGLLCVPIVASGVFLAQRRGRRRITA
jgi:uncharacterized membrane protein YdcZ (DUF606 family)